ncbi:ACP S-malonyltransferase [Nesterenkonia alba]|uniref:ACP S-malonyltransferase n=1 Tax=Nesterenkonia alba TaxID=515814 RepID=UPI0003B751A9|nr:ACP S-malonyltransferase [Nesterenkonia alba]
MLAIVCPGQGAQKPGLLTDWITDDDAARRLEKYSAWAGTDLRTHGTTSDEETIRDTAVAQPLITAATLLSAQALGLTPERLASFGDQVVLAGHSVGEIPAATLAGSLTEEQALRLIAVRATAMAEASAAAETGMAAVLGGVEEQVREAISTAGLTAANINGPGQIVAAGVQEKITALAENPPARARVIPLKVAGAFHTEYMDSARTALHQAVSDWTAADAVVDLLSNRDGEHVTAGAEILSRLVDQVTRPVRWDLVQKSLQARGVTGVLELLPGGTLTGLAKRGLKGTATVAVTSPEDLDAAAEFVAEHTA